MVRFGTKVDSCLAARQVEQVEHTVYGGLGSKLQISARSRYIKGSEHKATQLCKSILIFVSILGAPSTTSSPPEGLNVIIPIV